MAVRGDVGLIDAMNEITSGMVDKIAPAGMRGYLRVMAQGIKNEIPSDMKHARKGVGWRFKKGRGDDKVEAKVGGQVGINQARRAALANAAKADRDDDQPGVGISAWNIHWFMYGTKQRRHKPPRNQPTGKIDKENWVPVGAMKSRNQALAKFRELAGNAIEREAKKLRSKARAQLTKKAAGGAKKAIKGVMRGLT